ncbi:MAG TPA: hypothetical protein EYQ14_21345 [Gammaproteobacteria bacterium]|nr:hypothetical protein [Gammaproteobacteria bacterium]
MADWGQQELEFIVADYLDMLASELEGKKYRKADHKRNLLPSLNGRTEGSIEFKHQNRWGSFREVSPKALLAIRPQSLPRLKPA